MIELNFYNLAIVLTGPLLLRLTHYYTLTDTKTLNPLSGEVAEWLKAPQFRWKINENPKFVNQPFLIVSCEDFLPKHPILPRLQPQLSESPFSISAFKLNLRENFWRGWFWKVRKLSFPRFVKQISTTASSWEKIERKTLFETKSIGVKKNIHRKETRGEFLPKMVCCSLEEGFPWRLGLKHLTWGSEFEYHSRTLVW